jgi:hypothetical protein
MGKRQNDNVYADFKSVNVPLMANAPKTLSRQTSFEKAKIWPCANLFLFNLNFTARRGKLSLSYVLNF